MSTDAPGVAGARAGSGAGRWTAVGRAVALAGAAATGAGAAGLLAWRAGSRAARSLTAPGPARVDDVVVLGAALAAGALLAWCLGGGGAALGAALLRRLGRPSAALERASARLAPALVRRLAAAAVGVGVLGTVAGPASASAPAPAATAAASGAAVGGAVGGAVGVATPAAQQAPAVPSWPPEGAPWSAPAAPAPQAPPVQRAPLSAPPSTLPSAEGSRVLPDGDAGDVVVHRGDSLWSIAARSLPPGATASQVALEWPRWWAANRDVVGADPDLLLPGQLLRAPGAGR